MRKFFSLIAAVLFAGSMMAADAKVTLDLTDAGWGFPTSYSKEAATFTNGGYSLGFTAGTAGDGLKTMTVSKDDPTITGIIFGKTNAALTLPAMSFDVSKIIVYYVGASGSTAVVHNIFVGEDAVSTAVKGCSTNDRAGSEFNIAAASQAAGTVYVLKVTSSHNMQVSKIEFYEAVAGAPENPTFSVAAGTFIEAQEVELACATEGAKIYYTIDGTEPTDASNLYSAALTISETTTVKAIAINNGISSSVVSATYTIVETEGAGTQDDPFTIADVRLLNNGISGKFWVIGYIVGCAANEGVIGDDAVSNIALGATVDQTEGLVPVQLPNGSDARTALNIVDNPSNKGAQVKVHGDLVAYFQVPGVKNTDDYEIVGGVTPPTPVELDIVANEYIVYDVDGYFDLFMYSSDTWSYDYNDGWTVGEAGYALILDMVYTDMTDVTGTYSSADGSLDASYSSFVSWDGASENLTVAKLASGTVTIAWKDESHSAYVVTYDVIDVNGVNYKGTAEVDPYEEEEPPTADTEATLTIADAELMDGITDYQAFIVSGTDADGVELTLYFYGVTAIAGDFTEEDLYSAYSGITIGEDDIAIYSATINVVANEDGSYTITGDLLCYNNTLYHLQLTVPAPAGEGIEETLAAGKAVKVVLNGQVIVLKGDKAFNMNGQIVK